MIERLQVEDVWFMVVKMWCSDGFKYSSGDSL